MKKITALALPFLLFFFTAQIAFAGACTQNCGLSATTAIQNASAYLNPADSAGANFINTTLDNALAKAKEWKPDSALADFEYDENLGSEAAIAFHFISANDKDKIFEYSAGGTTIEKENSAKLIHGIYLIPVRMRDLIKSIQNDKTLLPFLDRLFGPDAVIEPHFRLAKNAADRLIWTVTLTDTKNAKSYIIKANAENIETPQFMVLAVR